MDSYKYGIIGFPLAQTLSPEIHNRAFKTINFPARYSKIEINPEDFDLKIKKLRTDKWDGFNVTVPYKTKIIKYLDEIDPIAEQIGAVNTVQQISDGRWKGYNTDYSGFLQPILKFKSEIKNCLVIGSGGAAKAVVFGLLNEFQVKNMVILNRTLSKAEQLVKGISSIKKNSIKVCDFETIIPSKYDLIVNTTIIGMGTHEQELILDPAEFSHKQTILYDLIYKTGQTPFLKAGTDMDLLTFNGWPMLVYQANDAFKIWTGENFSDELLSSFLKKNL